MVFWQADDHEYAEYVGKGASKKLATAMAARLAIEALGTKGLLPENGEQKPKRKKKKGALDRLAKKAGIPPPIFHPAVQDSLSDRWKVSCELIFKHDEVSPDRALTGNQCSIFLAFSNQMLYDRSLNDFTSPKTSRHSPNYFMGSAIRRRQRARTWCAS